MGWFRVRLSEDEQQVVLDHCDCHVDRLVRQRMWALWLLHCGETREKTAEILRVSRATVQRYVAAYRTGGLAGLASRGVAATASEWTLLDERLQAEFRERPARSVAEAGERIKALTGLERRPTQVRHHLHRLGLEYRRMRAIPAPPKKNWTNTSPTKPPSSTASCNRLSTPPSRAWATCSSWMPVTS
jgi:transposase